MNIGIDIQEVEAVKRFVASERARKIFSTREIEYLDMKNNNLETATGMWCAKEAFFKALGTGVIISQLTEVEILHSHSGAPYYHLSSDIIAKNHLNVSKVSLSISHTAKTAVAICIIDTRI